MIVQENILGKNLFSQLTSVVENLPWFFIENTAYNTLDDKFNLHDYSFQHISKINSSPNSYISDFSEIVVSAILDNANIEFKEIFKIRFGLITNTNSDIVHDPHVDLLHPHKTGLIYLDDADGDTILYNEKYDYSYNIPSYDYYKDVLKQQMSVQNIIIPKKNKFVCFDGAYYHSSSAPLKFNKRIVLSFCFN
jgi:hypothetical protein